MLVSLQKLIFAIGIRHIGQENAKLLSQYFLNIKNFNDLTKNFNFNSLANNSDIDTIFQNNSEYFLYISFSNNLILINLCILLLKILNKNI